MELVFSYVGVNTPCKCTIRQYIILYCVLYCGQRIRTTRKTLNGSKCIVFSVNILITQTLVDLRKELVTLREELVRDGALFPYADETLTKVMSGLNVASGDSMKVSAIQ